MSSFSFCEEVTLTHSCTQDPVQTNAMRIPNICARLIEIHDSVRHPRKTRKLQALPKGVMMKEDKEEEEKKKNKEEKKKKRTFTQSIEIQSLKNF